MQKMAKKWPISAGLAVAGGMVFGMAAFYRLSAEWRPNRATSRVSGSG
jgi:hypothetical protein